MRRRARREVGRAVLATLALALAVAGCGNTAGQLRGNFSGGSEAYARGR